MDSNLLRWAIIVLLLAHGIGHIMGFLQSWTSIPMGFTNQPSLLSNRVTIDSTVGRAFGLLWLVAMIAFLGAVFGLVAHQEWWRTLAIAAALISLMAILPWWNTVTVGARWGTVLVNAAILLALLPTWGEQIVRSIW
jgi:cytochrome c biogenesis protein CcdA